MFYAKPYKTIQEHTNDLLRQYDFFKEKYSERLTEEEWLLLNVAILYHDLGKMNPDFQDKIMNIMKNLERKINYMEVPHNFLSPCFIDYDAFSSDVGETNANLVLAGIYYHHDREDIKDNTDPVAAYREKMIKEVLPVTFKKFCYKDLVYRAEGLNRKSLRKAKAFIRTMNNNRNFNTETFRRYVLIKGLLNRIDYVASADIKDFEIEQDHIDAEGLSLADRIEKVFVSKNPGNSFESMLRPAQVFMKENKDRNIILTSSTGSGKTEAALLWIGQDKAFFTLPLKVAINAIYQRIKGDEKGQYGYTPAEVLHSGIGEIYLQEDKDGSNIAQRINMARLLSSPLTVCTIDQLFHFSLKHNGFEPILATLSYSKVVIDEIQMYSPELVAYLMYGLKLIHQMGGKFAIMTATVPDYLLDLLNDYLEDAHIVRKVFLDTTPAKHQLCYRPSEMNYEEILEKGQNHKVLVIANTVKKAQLHFSNLCEAAKENGVSLKLLHSNFLKKDRRVLEECILKFGHPDNPEVGIWVTTQIVEASVDVDFDLLYTEMCSIDSLIQRIGRILRHRLRLDGLVFPNVIIHDTGDGRGKNNVIHPVIYDASVKAVTSFIESNPDTWVAENDKIWLMNQVYSKAENPRIKEFENEMIEILNALENNPLYTISGVEAKKLLRNIVSETVIPLEIFEKLSAEGTIAEWDAVLGKEKVSPDEKIKTIIEIQEYTVNVSGKAGDSSYSTGFSFLDRVGIKIIDRKYDFDVAVMSGQGLLRNEEVEGSNFID